MTQYYCPKCHLNHSLEEVRKFSVGSKRSYLCPKCEDPCTIVNDEVEVLSGAPNRTVSLLKDLIFGHKTDAHPLFFAGRILIILGVIYLSWKFFTIKQIEDIPHMRNFVLFLLNKVNLAFHEAGHLFFRPFGRLMMFLGGSINQILMPLILFFAFWLYRKDTFGASIMLWWTGENFYDVAPYINDARALDLILLGGKTGKEVNEHDWENILDTLGMLHYDYIIADYSMLIGKVLMIIAITWGIVVLISQVKRVSVMPSNLG